MKKQNSGKKTKTKNPLLQEKYHEGFNNGFEIGFHEARDTAVAHMATRLERLGNVKGIGEVIMKRILAEIERPLTPEENKKAEGAVMHMKKLRLEKSGK